MKASGRNNGNCKYKTLDDDFFVSLDEAKAYLLGWIASDGSIRKNSIAIAINPKDLSVLKILRDIICPELPIKYKDNRLVYFTINSKKIVQDVCKWLGISPGGKSYKTRMLIYNEEHIRWAFLRGYFDGDGNIRNISYSSPECKITSISNEMRTSIKEFCGIPCHDNGAELIWNGNNAIDFLGKIYDYANYYLNRKRDLYLDWSTWVPILGGNKNSGKYDKIFYWAKTDVNGIKPSKTRSSDSGYDITIIGIAKDFGDTKLYKTGIRVTPVFGWYFDMVPRSSIIKTGYILSNSIGVIDRTYKGEILVALTKIDKTKPDIELPCKMVQIIPRPIIHCEFVEVDHTDTTNRGEGGFGSTGK